MIHPDFTILYVDNPAESAAFYERLLEIVPLEAEVAREICTVGISGISA